MKFPLYWMDHDGWIFPVPRPALKSESKKPESRKPDSRKPETTEPKAETDINATIAGRIRALRDLCGLSIEALAERSGVSRSMISLVERGETSPTAALLDRLAAALGTTLARLFEPAGEPDGPVTRKACQPLWRDPASGYVRRTVSPAGALIQIVEVGFPPGAEVAYDTARRHRVHHQVWVLSGAIEVTVGLDTHALAAGDCLDFMLDRPTRYRNSAGKPARYALIVVEE
jgi:transcriptional regulator with XRE-family HTH domain